MPVFSTRMIVVGRAEHLAVADEEELGGIVALDEVRRHLDPGLEQRLLRHGHAVVELGVGAARLPERISALGEGRVSSMLSLPPTRRTAWSMPMP